MSLAACGAATLSLVPEVPADLPPIPQWEAAPGFSDKILHSAAPGLPWARAELVLCRPDRDHPGQELEQRLWLEHTRLFGEQIRRQGGVVSEYRRIVPFPEDLQVILGAPWKDSPAFRKEDPRTCLLRLQGPGAPKATTAPAWQQRRASTKDAQWPDETLAGLEAALEALFAQTPPVYAAPSSTVLSLALSDDLGPLRYVEFRLEDGRGRVIVRDLGLIDETSESAESADAEAALSDEQLHRLLRDAGRRGLLRHLAAGEVALAPQDLVESGAHETPTQVELRYAAKGRYRLERYTGRCVITGYRFFPRRSRSDEAISDSAQALLDFLLSLSLRLSGGS